MEEEELKKVNEANDQPIAMQTSGSGHSTYANDDERQSAVLNAATNNNHQVELSGSDMSTTPATFHNDTLSGVEQPKERVDSADPEKKRRIGGMDLTPQVGGFTDLVRRWESYTCEGLAKVEQFQPLQMLQNLRLCGQGGDMSELTNHLRDSSNVTPNGGNLSEGDPFESIILRHAHSTPLQYRAALFDNNDGSGLPPPSLLDTTRRSSSTPSYTSAFHQHSSNSAFGTHHLRSMPCLQDHDDRSAFSLPAHRPSLAMSDSGIGYSAFDPLPSYSNPAPEQNTPQITNDTTKSMEIETIQNEERNKVEKGNGVENMDEEKKLAPKSKGSGSRAAKFFSDVGLLRRRRNRGGRENPAHLSLTSTPSTREDATMSEIKSNLKCDAMKASSRGDKERINPPRRSPESDQSATNQYHQLDSDVEEDPMNIQRIETSIQADSPTPSPTLYENLDDRIRQNSTLPKIRIQVANGNSSPGPGQMLRDSSSNLTPRSQDSGTTSPGNSRSSGTSHTSGHTTQATSTTSAGHHSSLSSISETDREVMEAIKAGKRRRRQQILPTRKGETDGTSVHSGSSTSTNNSGYMALTGSPVPLREGANVPADRFFTNSHSVSHGSPGSNHFGFGMGLFGQQTQSHASSSPTTRSPEPPTFVSYLDRQNTSDLTSLRGGGSSTNSRYRRGEISEERESYSADGCNEVIFEEANADREKSTSQHPKAIRPVRDRIRGRLDKFRSRPPRSPAKGSRTPTTPPPRKTPSPRGGSPSYYQLSPPRNIVDHRIGSNVSRPYVVRTNPLGRKLNQISPDTGTLRPINPGWGGEANHYGSQEFIPSQAGGSRGVEIFNRNPLTNNWSETQGSYGNRNSPVTYEEQSIEIMKVDSKDEMSGPRFITPEK